MSSSDAQAFSSHPAFCGIDPDRQKDIFGQLIVRSFTVGQPLSTSKSISSEIFLIISGNARLVGRERGTLSTIEKLAEGHFVGLASFLRVQACEEVRASSEVEALVITDELLLELLRTEPSFANWCNSTLFSAELYALIEHLFLASARQDLSEQKELSTLQSAAALLAPNIRALTDHSADLVVMAASNNMPSHPIGSRIDRDTGIPRSNPPLPARFITVPLSWYTEIIQPSGETASSLDVSSLPASESSTNTTDKFSPPLATGLNLGQRDSLPFRLHRGEGPIDETLACFQMLANEFKLPFRRDAIEKILRDNLRRGQSPDLQLCGNIAATMGLHVTGVSVQARQGTRMQIPALIPWKGGFAVVRDSNARGLYLASPSQGLLHLNPESLQEYFPEGIDMLLLERRNTSPNQRFGFAWFWPALSKYRRTLSQILLASFVVQLFSLANPLLIQVIIDKVISQRSLDTLQVLGFALIVVTVMEGVLGGLRTSLFTQTTNRIDMRLGAEVIDHLLRLPLNYFDKRPVGELGSRIAELEKIRNFLTGQALSTVLDTFFSIIYIGVMILYSWVLTLIALCVLPIQIMMTIIGAPLFRRQYRDTATENARTQSHLVEILSGIQTVKAQNVEMISRWKWQGFYNAFMSRSFEKTVTGTVIVETSQVLQKVSQLLVLWVGATLVLKGELSLGQLIAFRIISGYVTQPLLRLSSIWQNIQELKVSFERLSDVVDTPEESDDEDKGKLPLPPIEGKVTFSDVSFRFTPGKPLVLNEINIRVDPGTFVGVVGQSGSGKSTLTKMISRLYSPTSGKILIDGYDIQKVELYSLRRQIGIVPQDPLLFSGSVAENIALTDPDATSESIMNAARLACAHDFIMELAAGYNENVGERGAGLSGGQRQRIALARTLLSNPRLLILDEATSALDYDTERRVCNNLLDNLSKCTVFFITHRLSTIKRADLIIMMHEGTIAEVGTHDELLNRRGRYYALYRQQEAS